MPYVTIDRMRMHYSECGSPDGPPILLLHGFTGTAGREWSRHVAAFSGRYRLILPDLRGHGRTDNPDGTAAMRHRRFAEDIVTLCHSLGIERAAFCGQSTGSMLQL